MIGCDVTKISRFAGKSERFVDKILTPYELAEYKTRHNKAEYLASRWAAKEAVFKATGIKNPSVLNDEFGKPYIIDHPKIFITISHEKEYAFAVAIDKRSE
jgi:phosphopantetheine--protein transferase-like protein